MNTENTEINLNIKKFSFNNDSYKNIKTDLKNFLVEKINDLTINYGFNYNPFVNGKYMVFMIDGPWFDTITDITSDEIKGFISDTSFFVQNGTAVHW